MKVKILNMKFDPWQEVSSYQGQRVQQGKFGATTIFIGTMRDFNEGQEVTSMCLEHYPEMTKKHLEEIANNAIQKYDIQDVLIIHRVGQIFPNDPIVCVAAWSTHRAAAYDANRFIMEDLKAKAPFWKKETLIEEERWLDKNTPG